MRSLLISILLQVKAPWLWAFPDAHDLIDGIKKHLEGKRYVYQLHKQINDLLSITFYTREKPRA